LALLAVGALIGYNGLARNTDAFHNKFDFLFPSPDPWVIVDRLAGAHRTFSGELDITGLPQDGIIMRMLPPAHARRATVVVRGELLEGTLSFSKQQAPEHQMVVQSILSRHGPFEVRIEVDKDRGDGEIRITQAGRPARGVVHELRWSYPVSSPENPAPKPPAETADGLRGEINHAPDHFTLSRIRNIAERFSDWKLFGRGIFDTPESFLFGHAKPLARDQRTSAHNFYIDFVYNFGALALLPLLLLIAYTAALAWRNRALLQSSESLTALALVVAFLVLVESSLKVTLRQPYPGTAVYFLWGLLLAALSRPMGRPRNVS
jgi:hypothetical protein